jgi:prolipoprotein diacylglyceryltransferase
MHLLILLPVFFIFLYALFKFSGDDHVFIRKNISLEQVFDVAFGTLWISLIFARIFYFIFHPGGASLFILFFSAKDGFSMVGGVLGAILGLYIIGKYRKVPLGRLYDFFTLSALFALPAGLYLDLVLPHKGDFMYQIISATAYLLLLIFFFRLLYPRLLSRSLKEGNLTIVFLSFYSLFTLLISFIQFGKVSIEFLNIQSILLISLFFLSVFLLIKQEAGRSRRKI